MATIVKTEFYSIKEKPGIAEDDLQYDLELTHDLTFSLALIKRKPIFNCYISLRSSCCREKLYPHSTSGLGSDSLTYCGKCGKDYFYPHSEIYLDDDFNSFMFDTLSIAKYNTLEAILISSEIECFVREKVEDFDD